MAVALLGDVLQNLPELHTRPRLSTPPPARACARGRPYHVLLDVLALRHLDERLEQPAVMLDEDLTGLSVSALGHTAAASDRGWRLRSERLTGSSAHLDAQIQRGDPVLVSQVFGPAGQKDLRRVSLSVAAGRGGGVRRKRAER